MTTQSKRSTMTLYASKKCPFSHRVMMVLAEKGVVADVKLIELDNKPDELLELNPYAQVPTLVDRDVIVYESEIIFEYLEERFPHPPLLSVFPIERAQSRLLTRRIDKDWIPHLTQALYSKDESVIYKSKLELVKAILEMMPVFKRYRYFMSDDFSIVDCTLAAILYRFPELGIALPDKAQAIKSYQKRLFDREAFITSVEMLKGGS
ncbi:glutathione S-transferase N-terminal domain-containing protein [Thiotrichales bacterium 19S9-12]|nr:glutathione S-transferase N-terminal domain-containing protein [Thiotrichales bacterium 19S9-11]MCF6811082.1 glutathione S-transferase N-terminal domain-containing protein [Thiotrichales bacterium 19S9-12]